MTEGMHLVRKESGTGENVRISHAKAFGLLERELIVADNLPLELAQGLFSQPGRHPVLVRLAAAHGEINDDSKINTVRGIWFEGLQERSCIDYVVKLGVVPDTPRRKALFD